MKQISAMFIQSETTLNIKLNIQIVQILSDCRTYTRDFLQKITQEIWGSSFEKIRLSDLVKYERVKEHLTKAESAFEQNDYSETVNQSAAALHIALRKVKKPITGETINFDSDVDSALRIIQENLLIVVLGMDYANHARFEALTPAVLFMGDGSINFAGYNTARKFSNDEAEFVLNYCIDAVVQIENRVGSIEDPFNF